MAIRTFLIEEKVIKNFENAYKHVNFSRGSWKSISAYKHAYKHACGDVMLTSKLRSHTEMHKAMLTFTKMLTSTVCEHPFKELLMTSP